MGDGILKEVKTILRKHTLLTEENDESSKREPETGKSQTNTT